MPVFLLIVASIDHNSKQPQDMVHNEGRKQQFTSENNSCGALNVTALKESKVGLGKVCVCVRLCVLMCLYAGHKCVWLYSK